MSVVLLAVVGVVVIYALNREVFPGPARLWRSMRRRLRR